MKENLGKGHDGLPGHPTPTSPSVVDKIWVELDHYIDTALDWPQVAADSSVWASETDEIAYLRNELAKAKAAAAGRGLAIALSHMQYAKYADSNAVMAEAMQRREHRKNSTPADEAQQQVISPDPTVAPGAPTPGNPASVTTVSATPPAEPAAPAPQAPETSPEPAALGEHEIARIREALDQGFDADSLASMFGISTEQIAAYAAGVV